MLRSLVGSEMCIRDRKRHNEMAHDGVPPPDTSGLDVMANAKIRAAIQAGAFDNLPGKGKPLGERSRVGEGPEAVGHKILKNSGAAPDWIVRGKGLRGRASEVRERLARGEEDACGTAQQLNREIREYNLSVPSVSFHIVPIQI
eukprot:TRINITY_DN31419_c0_g1_i1.p1 TRINITY_DN31419_c0_g1~~TRINITY_DN31419_c0_g1_i1.p1  ORF type:complete len:144 (+),score=31.60 TRINITY_DN31419_c0_g1_i1:136-567(+)